MRSIGFTLIIAVNLVACVPLVSPGGAPPLPTVPLEAVFILTPTTAPTANPTPRPLPTMKPTPAACRRFVPDLEAPIPLPDLASLSWQTLSIPGQHVHQFTGFKYPVFPLQSSPDGRWVQIALEFHPDVYINAAKAIIDTQDKAHQWLDTETFFYLDDYFAPYYHPRSPWLPDGRLLWGEGDKIFFGNPQNPQILEPPEPIGELQYATEDIAFARTVREGDLWRVDLRSGKWEKVTTPRPPRVGNLGNFFTLAWNGFYGIAFQEGQMWRIPTQMGAVAEPLPDVSVRIIGRGGGPNPTGELANSPYWLIGSPTEETGEGFIVDLRNGHVITPGDLGLTSYRFREASLSPQGHWLTITLSPTGRNDPNLDLYIAPSEDLKAGYVLKGVSVAGWQADPPAVILKDNTTSALQVMRLPLSSTPSYIPLPDAKPPIATLPNAIFTVDIGSPAQLLQFDRDGKLVRTLDLSMYYTEIYAIKGAIDRVFIGATSNRPEKDGACTYALIEWAVGP